MFVRLRLNHRLWACACFLALGACSKEDPLNPASELQNTPVETRALTLELEGSPDVQMLFGERTDFTVRVLYADTQAPAANIPVMYALEGTSTGCVLASTQVKTSIDGRALNTLTAGNDKVQFAVVVSVSDKIQLRIPASVNGTYTSRLHVRFDYRDVIPLHDIVTKVHRTSSCNAVASAPPVPAQNIRTATNANSIVSFEGLDENRIYTVTAVALGPNGQPAAEGCTVTAPLVGRSQTTVLMPLQRYPAVLTGDYDIATEWALQEALPGVAGDVISTVDELLSNPADALAETLAETLATYTNQSIETARSLLSAAWVLYALQSGEPLDGDNDGQVLDDALTFAIFDRLPSWAVTGINTGAGLTQLLTHMTVGGKLSITEVLDEQADGRLLFTDYMFIWRGNRTCALGDACCGRITYSAQEMGLAPMATDFTAEVKPLPTTDRILYTFNLNNQPLSLQYGNIAFFLLEHVLLAQTTGASSIEGAIENMIGCTNNQDLSTCGCGRAGAFIDNMIRTQGLGTMLCRTALEGVANLVEAQLNNLSTAGNQDAQLSMSVRAQLADANHDLLADDLRGTVQGTFTVARESSPFTGTLRGSAHAEPCTSNNTCQAGQQCQIRPDVLNTCQAQQICGFAVGIKSAGERCTHNNDCQSGTCASNRRCVALCDTHEDCPQGMSCAYDAVTVSLEDQASATVNTCSM
jgi:hypothetical protein